MKSRNNGERPFSETHPEAVYSRKTRKKKAATIIHVLRDHLVDDLWSCSLLDVGCSTGIIADFLSAFVEEVVGIDTDRPAIELLI